MVKMRKTSKTLSTHKIKQTKILRCEPQIGLILANDVILNSTKHLKLEPEYIFCSFLCLFIRTTD